MQVFTPFAIRAQDSRRLWNAVVRSGGWRIYVNHFDCDALIEMYRIRTGTVASACRLVMGCPRFKWHRGPGLAVYVEQREDVMSTDAPLGQAVRTCLDPGGSRHAAT